MRKDLVVSLISKLDHIFTTTLMNTYTKPPYNYIFRKLDIINNSHM